MILVTGGCFQGKTEYALEKFQISRDEAADGRTCPLHMIYTTKLLYHFHEYIRRLIKEEQELSVEELLQKNPEICIVTNELGYGVVPIEPFDRKWREKTGRICTELAAKADSVTRVVCGIGILLKGEEKHD